MQATNSAHLNKKAFGKSRGTNRNNTDERKTPAPAIISGGSNNREKYNAAPNPRNTGTHKRVFSCWVATQFSILFHIKQFIFP
jgi:hypothetical protein